MRLSDQPGAEGQSAAASPDGILFARRLASGVRRLGERPEHSAATEAAAASACYSLDRELENESSSAAATCQPPSRPRSRTLFCLGAHGVHSLVPAFPHVHSGAESVSCEAMHLRGRPGESDCSHWCRRLARNAAKFHWARNDESASLIMIAPVDVSNSLAETLWHHRLFTLCLYDTAELRADWRVPCCGADSTPLPNSTFVEKLARDLVEKDERIWFAIC